MFLESLSDKPIVSVACERATVSRSRAYDERKADPAFKAAWDEALESSLEALEDEARRRALSISDTLLIFLLKAHAPDKYRDKLDLHIKRDDLKSMSDEELERLAGGNQ